MSQPDRKRLQTDDDDATPSPKGKGTDLDAIRAIAEPLVHAHGLELVDIEWTTAHGGRVLRVTIDLPEPPETEETNEPAEPPPSVSLEDCVRLSRDLSTVLDVEDSIPQRYSLEVSSPGLDRPLKSARDFRRQVGRVAKVKLHKPAPDGQSVLRGTILGADDSGVDMDVDGNQHHFGIENVREAKLVFDFGPSKGRQQKKGGARKRSRSKNKQGGKRRSRAHKAGR